MDFRRVDEGLLALRRLVLHESDEELRSLEQAIKASPDDKGTAERLVRALLRAGRAGDVGDWVVKAGILTEAQFKVFTRLLGMDKPLAATYLEEPDADARRNSHLDLDNLVYESTFEQYRDVIHEEDYYAAKKVFADDEVAQLNHQLQQNSKEHLTADEIETIFDHVGAIVQHGSRGNTEVDYFKDETQLNVSWDGLESAHRRDNPEDEGGDREEGDEE